MGDRVDMGIEDAVRLLVRATGERYELVGRLAGGATGAHEVRTDDGRRFVLKWELDPRNQVARRAAVGLTRRLADEAGWPVPGQVAIDAEGCLLVLQDLCPGEPVTQVTHALVDEVLALHARRLGLAGDEPSWNDDLVETLVVGGNGYCRHDTLRGHDARAAALVERVEQIGHDIDAGDLPGGDIVHHDLHPGNLLVHRGRLTAVIDNDYVTTGDATFDLTVLALTALAVPCEAGVRDRLLALGVDALDEPRRLAYVGHLLVRILDWAIRLDETDEIEVYLAGADRLLVG
jgi:hypothetical protein